jgi:hypothetical protein
MIGAWLTAWGNGFNGLTLSNIMRLVLCKIGSHFSLEF